MSLDDVVDGYYSNSFDLAYRFGMSLIEREKELGAAQLRGILRGLYVRQGNDMTGRGLFGDADIEASIAAYELVLATYDGRLPAEFNKTSPNS